MVTFNSLTSKGENICVYICISSQSKFCFSLSIWNSIVSCFSQRNKLMYEASNHGIKVLERFFSGNGLEYMRCDKFATNA